MHVLNGEPIVATTSKKLPAKQLPEFLVLPVDEFALGSLLDTSPVSGGDQYCQTIAIVSAAA